MMMIMMIDDGTMMIDDGTMMMMIDDVN